jgi:hypothetical protein
MCASCVLDRDERAMSTIFRIVYAVSVVVVGLLALLTAAMVVGTLFPRIDPATGRNTGEWVAVGILFNGVVVVYGLLAVGVGRSVRAHIGNTAASPGSRMLALASWAIFGAGPPVAYAVMGLLFALPR